MNVLQVPEREFLAFHEAGHAVMATILGRPIRRASIRQRTRRKIQAAALVHSQAKKIARKNPSAPSPS